ncbi:hypothetical protein ACQKK5_25885 [Brevibacillus panacihumi]|uniref:hypothetical protein n=1 Tax=Brevibacillus panacihumi TaxID=497735 RepID=UPI003D07CC29
MKWGDWLIVSLFLIIGLSCMTMSATWMMGTNAISSYLHNLFHICLWGGVPITVAAVIYVMIRKWKNERNG